MCDPGAGLALLANLKTEILDRCGLRKNCEQLSREIQGLKLMRIVIGSGHTFENKLNSLDTFC